MQPAFVPGKKIDLRVYNEETDLHEYYKWINDPAVTQYMDDIYPVTLDEARERLRKLASPDMDNVIFFLQEKNSGGIPIGITGLYDMDDVHRRARTRTMIGSVEHFSRGYGTESKILLFWYAFYRINLHHITSIVQAENIASIKSLKRVGYKKEGILRQNTFFDGRWVNDIIFGITKKDFRPVWEKYNESLKK